MEKGRRGWLRPVLAIGVLGALTAALLTSPANAHLTTFSHLKQHIKKIATKIAKKQARTIVQTTVGPTLFVEESELVRFGPINLDADATENIGTFGAASFTLEASCQEDAGTLDAEILITTSRDDSAFDSAVDGDGDFDTGDTGVWASSSVALGDPQAINSYDADTAHAWSPNGLVLNAEGNTIVTNASNGSDCVFAGAVLMVSPGTA